MNCSRPTGPAWPRPTWRPSVLICGDLHLENFGAYRTTDGDFLYDINVFDEAIVAPCSLDLVLCATSILLTDQTGKQTSVQAMRNLLAFLDRFRSMVTKSVRSGHVGEMALGTVSGPIWGLQRGPLVAIKRVFSRASRSEQATEAGASSAPRGGFAPSATA
ncbi:MAG TPA: DUF2252 family protein [Isosphaeraceae bacterium]|nr:DUF2252 family protein [Isosphaeraceae bacterium]